MPPPRSTTPLLPVSVPQVLESSAWPATAPFTTPNTSSTSLPVRPSPWLGTIPAPLLTRTTSSILTCNPPLLSPFLSLSLPALAVSSIAATSSSPKTIARSPISLSPSKPSPPPPTPSPPTGNSSTPANTSKSHSRPSPSPKSSIATIRSSSTSAPWLPSTLPAPNPNSPPTIRISSSHRPSSSRTSSSSRTTSPRILSLPTSSMSRSFPLTSLNPPPPSKRPLLKMPSRKPTPSAPTFRNSITTSRMPMWTSAPPRMHFCRRLLSPPITNRKVSPATLS